MKPSLLVIVDSDPRSNARAAEAVRIAAGVGTWKKAEVHLYLRGPAVLALTEFPDELLEEDNYTRYLPIVCEFGRPVRVQKGAMEGFDLGTPTQPFEEIDDAELSRLAARSTYVLRF